MATVTQLKTFMSKRTGLATTGTDGAVLEEALTRAYHLICTQAECLVGTFTYTFSTAKSQLAMDSDIGLTDFYRLIDLQWAGEVPNYHSQAISKVSYDDLRAYARGSMTDPDHNPYVYAWQAPNKLIFRTEISEGTISGTYLKRPPKLSSTIGAVDAVNEKQVIYFETTADGGAFTVQDPTSGLTSTSIAYNISEPDFLAVMEEIYGEDNITVDITNGGKNFEVTFVNDLAGETLEDMVVVTNTVTNSANPIGIYVSKAVVGSPAVDGSATQTVPLALPEAYHYALLANLACGYAMEYQRIDPVSIKYVIDTALEHMSALKKEIHQAGGPGPSIKRGL